MTTVKFANPSGFLAELQKDRRHVDRGIVQVAVVAEPCPLKRCWDPSCWSQHLPRRTHLQNALQGQSGRQGGMAQMHKQLKNLRGAA
jgi:hypothetical protein